VTARTTGTGDQKVERDPRALPRNDPSAFRFRPTIPHDPVWSSIF